MLWKYQINKILQLSQKKKLTTEITEKKKTRSGNYIHHLAEYTKGRETLTLSVCSVNSVACICGL